jgi:hypothetical protein
MSVRLSACISTSPTGMTFVKFDIFTQIYRETPDFVKIKTKNVYHFTRTRVFHIVSDMFSATIQRRLGCVSVATLSWQPLYVCQQYKGKEMLSLNGKNSYATAPEYRVVRTWPILLTFRHRASCI